MLLWILAVVTLLVGVGVGMFAGWHFAINSAADRIKLADDKLRIAREKEEAADQTVRERVRVETQTMRNRMEMAIAERKKSEERALAIEQLTLQRAIESGLVKVPNFKVKHLCGCGHSQSYHEKGTGPCKRLMNPGLSTAHACGCQIYVEVR